MQIIIAADEGLTFDFPSRAMSCRHITSVLMIGKTRLNTWENESFSGEDNTMEKEQQSN